VERRSFIKTAALAAGAAGLTSACATLSPRSVRPAQLTRPADKLLLTNCNLVDVDAGRLMPERQILIKDGKIAGIPPAEKLAEIGPDRQIDLNGAFVMPGLINAHAHLTLPGGVSMSLAMLQAYDRQIERGAELCVAGGVTTVRDVMSLSDWLPALQAKIERGEVVGPRIVRACAMDIPKGYGTTALLVSPDPRFFQEAPNPEGGREAVRRAVDGGADLIKIFQQDRSLMMSGPSLPLMDVATMRAICDEAHRHGRLCRCTTPHAKGC